MIIEMGDPLSNSAPSLFERFTNPLLGLPVSHVWRGYGSALFIEFGDLTPGAIRKDGFAGHPRGQITLMMEWSWRIERPRSILGGSFNDESRWPKVFEKLLGATVESATLFGRLPEISISLSNDLHIASFMTADGQPQWTLFDNQSPDVSWLTVKQGRVVHERINGHSKKRGLEPK